MPTSLNSVTRPPMTWQAIQSMALRRRWWFLVPFFLAWAVAFTLSWVLPKKYQSQALLVVDQQTVPATYVQPNVVFNADTLLQNMAQRILSRARLEKIMQRYNLYPKIQATLGPDAAVRALRKDISITPVQLGNLAPDNAHNWTAFSIAYTGSSPEQARQVASRLTSAFIEENLRVTQQASNRTTSFLQQQWAQAQQAVKLDEQNIQKFERNNLGTLPGQSQANLAVVLSLENRLGDAQGALLRSQQRIAYDENLLKQQRNWAAAAPLEQRLQNLRMKLADLRSRYTEQYPSIPQVEGEIARLQARLKKLMAAPAGGAAGAPAGASGANTANDTEAALAGMPTRTQIKSDMQSEKLMESREKRQVASLNQELQQYQFRLNQEPVRGNQLASLEAQYQQDQSNATALLLRLNNSKLASRLEQRQGGAQFRIVDAPNLPEKPVWPKPLQFSGFGLLAGIALGLAITAGVELRQDQIHSSQELAQFALPPILCRIPPLQSTMDRVRKRSLHTLEWAIVTVLLGAMIVGNYLILHLHR